MKDYKFIIDILVLLFVIDDGIVLAVNKDLAKNISLNSTIKNSHEEFHSKTDIATSLHHNNNSLNVAHIQPQSKNLSSNSSISYHHLDTKNFTKPDLLLNATSTIASSSKHEKVIFAEGGIEVTSHYPLKSEANETNKNITSVNTATNKNITSVNTATNKNITSVNTVTKKNITSVNTVTNKNITSVNIVTLHPSTTSKMVSSPMNLTTPGFNSTQIHKRIHGRPGVSEIVTPSTTTNKSSSTTTISPRPKKKKPFFTMITGDKETKHSESFIESSTTGRDYVLPIVLIILSLPIVGFLIKIIYRRGTEFTERQQYHRMYLIDGMYNSR